MSRDHASKKEQIKTSFSSTPVEYMFIYLTGIFLFLFWIWFIFFRVIEINSDKKVIQERAINEILTQCNRAVSAIEFGGFFKRQDIKIRKISMAQGVTTYVSTLEVSRNGIACQWDGIDPAYLTREEPRGATGE